MKVANHDPEYWMTDADVKSAAAEFAPGISDRSAMGDPSMLEQGSMVPYVVQLHKALRAGPHHDIRMGKDKMLSWATKKDLPKPGGKSIALFPQSLHDESYSRFQGTIGQGYGKGVVRQADFGKVLITHASPNKIKFTVAHHQMPEDFTLVRMAEKPGKKPAWLMMNTTPTETIPYKKEHYKKIPAEQIDKLMDPNYVMSAKIDGASSFLKLMKDKVDVLSYRTSKKTGGPIVHTHRMGLAGQRFDIPKELQNTIMRGEIYGTRAGKDGRAIPAAELGGLLNASLANSLESQKQKNIKMHMALFGAKRVGGKPWEGKTHEETRKIIQGALKFLPKDMFGEPEYATTEEEKRRMWESITGHKHPLTHEGVVGFPVSGETPIKAKPVADYDVHIREIFPQIVGALKGKTAGGFKYSLTPSGPVVGETGTGMSAEERKQMHEHPEEYVGRIARIQSPEQFPSGAYRAPVYVARHEDYPEKAAAAPEFELPSWVPEWVKGMKFQVPKVVNQTGAATNVVHDLAKQLGVVPRTLLNVPARVKTVDQFYSLLPQSQQRSLDAGMMKMIGSKGGKGTFTVGEVPSLVKHLPPAVLHPAVQTPLNALKGQQATQAYMRLAYPKPALKKQSSVNIVEDVDPDTNSVHRRFVALDANGSKMGTVIAQPSARTGRVEITGLYVKPAARNKGVATALIDRIRETHKDAVLSLKPFPFGDKVLAESELRSMYDRMGFTGSGEMLMKSAAATSTAFKQGLESASARPVPTVTVSKPARVQPVTTPRPVRNQPVAVKSVAPEITQYASDASKYLARYPKTPITGQMLASAWDKAGRPKLDPIYAVAQAAIESGAGIKGRNPTTNPYNVGEFDKGTKMRFPNTEAGVNAYYNLMAKKYLGDQRSMSDLQNKFVDLQGRRYASNPKYESMLQSVVRSLQRYAEREV